MVVVVVGVGVLLTHFQINCLYHSIFPHISLVHYPSRIALRSRDTHFLACPNHVDMFEFLLKTQSISFSLTQMLTKQDEGKEVVGVLLQ